MQGLAASLVVEPPCRAWLPTRRPSNNRRRSSGSRCLASQSGSSGAETQPEQQQQQPRPRQLAASDYPTWQQQLGNVSRRGAAAIAAAALAAAATLTPPLAAPPAADAVTQEQLLFLEAWRAVDRAFVDKKFNGQNWFKVGAQPAARAADRAARPASCQRCTLHPSAPSSLLPYITL